MSGEDPAAPAVDRARLKAFLGRVIEDFGGTMATLMCSLGDRLGLFQALAELGPATSAELAARAGVDERYTREWLACLAAAGYLTYDPASEHFSLPPEHAAVLADRSSPLFLGGSYEWLFGVAGVFDQIAEGFRTGRGVPAAAYPGEVWSGMERLSARNVEHRLVQDWLPAVPGLRERLEEGAEVADVGCGGGHVLIRLAQAFPRSRFTGFDAF
ncbi:MAG: SAM-dependent methyltransferase, partial [Thermomicrobiaceae bacterium]|nr:SAM-dependent methyltransferase [Thermomicrobiaceae bacterium]